MQLRPPSGEDIASATLNQLARDKLGVTEGLAMSMWFSELVRKASQIHRSFDLNHLTTLLLDDHAIVWPHAECPGFHDYVEKLSRSFTVHQIVHDARDNTFYQVTDATRASIGLRIPLIEQLSSIYGSRPKIRKDITVSTPQDDIRRNQAFWAYIQPFYGDDVWSKVGLVRYLINDVIGQFFQYVVDVDMVVSTKTDTWVVEVKHKDPMKCNPSFGINKTELSRINKIISCGLRVLHAVIVKPYRDRSISSMQLLHDHKTHISTALLCVELTKPIIDAMSQACL
jgi:hypothetical protein